MAKPKASLAPVALGKKAAKTSVVKAPVAKGFKVQAKAPAKPVKALMALPPMQAWPFQMLGKASPVAKAPKPIGSTSAAKGAVNHWPFAKASAVLQGISAGAFKKKAAPTPKPKPIAISRIDSASATALRTQIKWMLAKSVPAKARLAACLDRWVDLGGKVSDFAKERGDSLFDSIHACDKELASKLAAAGGVGWSHTGFAKNAWVLAKGEDASASLSAPARDAAVIAKRCLATSSGIAGLVSCAKRAAILCSLDPKLAAQVEAGFKWALDDFMPSAQGLLRLEPCLSRAVQLGQALGGGCPGAAADFAVKLRSSQRSALGSQAWGAAAFAAIDLDAVSVLERIVSGLLEEDPKGLSIAFKKSSHSYYGGRMESRVTLLAAALSAGKYECAKFLLDQGAADGLAYTSDLSANPFAALRAGVVKAANAKGAKSSSAAQAPAQMFSIIARRMVKRMLAEGFDIAKARAAVEAAADQANQRLTRSSSKSAFERLLLGQAVELANLGEDGEPVEQGKSVQTTARRL